VLILAGSQTWFRSTCYQCLPKSKVSHEGLGASANMSLTLVVFGGVVRLCLNPTAQKDNQGVLGASFRVEQVSEIVGYSNLVEFF